MSEVMGRQLPSPDSRTRRSGQEGDP